jgi:hypothetical protein
MMKRSLRVLAALAVAVAAVSMPTAAAAALPTTIAFAAPTIEAPFASDWVMEIQVTAPDSGYLVGPGDGRVEVVIDGVAGTWATLDLVAGGVAFLSQPADQPLLAAGTYSLRAILIPSGTALTSVTSAPATLTVTPLAVAADVTVTSAGEVLEVTSALTGEYLEATGTAPPGVWTFELSAVGRDTVIETRQRAQDAATLDPETVSFSVPIAAGTTYLVAWTFVPVDELAPGLVLEGTGTVEYRTPDATLFTWLTAPVEAPIWVWLGIALGLLALIAAVVVLALRRRRRLTELDATRTVGDGAA